MYTRAFLIACSIALACAGLARKTVGQVVGQPYRLNDKQVEQIIQRIENQSNTFRKSLDTALDKSQLNDTR